MWSQLAVESGQHFLAHLGGLYVASKEGNICAEELGSRWRMSEVWLGTVFMQPNKQGSIVRVVPGWWFGFGFFFLVENKLQIFFKRN